MKNKGFTLFVAIVVMGTLLLIAAGMASLSDKRLSPLLAANPNKHSTQPIPALSAPSIGMSKILPASAPFPLLRAQQFSVIRTVIIPVISGWWAVMILVRLTASTFFLIRLAPSWL